MKNLDQDPKIHLIFGNEGSENQKASKQKVVNVGLDI